MSRSNCTRRDFFRRFTDTLLDQVSVGCGNSQTAASSSGNNEIVVGRMAEFSPGTTKLVETADGTIFMVSSSYAGLSAQNTTTGRRVGLRVQRPGTLILQPSEGWTTSQILSHITEEKIDEN